MSDISVFFCVCCEVFFFFSSSFFHSTQNRKSNKKQGEEEKKEPTFLLLPSKLKKRPQCLLHIGWAASPEHSVDLFSLAKKKLLAFALVRSLNRRQMQRENAVNL